jgi:formamidopyrimidine-DNA glycosylase
VPELPEVETIVRGLRTKVLDQDVLTVDVLREDLLATPRRAFVTALTGRRIVEVSRRGKNIVVALASGGERVGFLVVNLGMTGRLLRVGPGEVSALLTHPGVRFGLGDGSTLVYHDIRRFGSLSAVRPDELRTWSASLGPEPLSRAFTRERFAQSLGRSAARVHSWLLDQTRVAGVGNIYASEALFRARVHPARRARELVLREAQLLHASVRKVLAEAVKGRGTTLKDYRSFEGWEGSYAGKLRVYGRAGRPCRRCGDTLQRVVIGGRSAFFCPGCQPSSDEAS